MQYFWVLLRHIRCDSFTFVTLKQNKYCILMISQKWRSFNVFPQMGTHTDLAPARYFHFSYVQYLVAMSSKFIISLSQSANQINGYGFSTFL